MKTNQEKFDVVVIGGGPAGMMAAIRAAELGAKVVLMEKNKSLGKKLMITGKGRCNITQAEFNHQALIQAIGRQGKFLFSSLAAFGPQEVINFFQKNGLATKIERGQRVFPVSDKAESVLKILLQELAAKKVTLLLEEKIKKFNTENQKITSLETNNGKISSRNFILATGGKSYPVTGSTGDGYTWAAQLGHQIIEPVPALVPIRTKEPWSHQLPGLSLKNVQINIFQNNKKQAGLFGEMLFTHSGLSGPIILEASKTIGQLLKNGPVTLELDLKPALDFDKLDKRLQRDFQEHLHKDFQNYLPELLPQKMINPIITLSQIDGRRKVSSLTKKERRTLVKLLKGLSLSVKGLMDFSQAIITSGGVNLKEVDSKTMQSRLVDNLFFAGEILDLDGPTGGYNLQIAWSTGYAAGTAAAEK